MRYLPETLQYLETERLQVCNALQELQLQCVRQGQDQSIESASEHLCHGASRRLSILRRAVAQIFLMFPPSASSRLPDDVRTDVEIQLHAFVINAYGIFENWAWAFVHRHGLAETIHFRHVGLFKSTLKPWLPNAICEYISSERAIRWHKDYLTNYRDALAHRIPLYVPPAIFLDEDGRRHDELEREKLSSILSGRFDRVEEIYVEQERLGSVCMAFMHSYSRDQGCLPVKLHPQLIADAKSIVEFGTLFLANWHATAQSSC